MNKSETRELNKLEAYAKTSNPDIGVLARSYSSLIRSTLNNKSREQMLTAAATNPAVTRHAEFTV